MATLINEGDTLLAKHLDGNSRKIEWKGIRKHPVTKKNMTLYECDRNSYAEIITKCIDEVMPGTESYYRDEGDSLEADAISIYVETFKKETFEVKECVSGRHGAKLFKFRKNSISTIKTPLPIFTSLVLEKVAKLKAK